MRWRTFWGIAMTAHDFSKPSMRWRTEGANALYDGGFSKPSMRWRTRIAMRSK